MHTNKNDYKTEHTGVPNVNLPGYNCTTKQPFPAMNNIVETTKLWLQKQKQKTNRLHIQQKTLLITTSSSDKTPPKTYQAVNKIM